MWGSPAASRKASNSAHVFPAPSASQYHLAPVFVHLSSPACRRRPRAAASPWQCLWSSPPHCLLDETGFPSMSGLVCTTRAHFELAIPSQIHKPSDQGARSWHSSPQVNHATLIRILQPVIAVAFSCQCLHVQQFDPNMTQQPRAPEFAHHTLPDLGWLIDSGAFHRPV